MKRITFLKTLGLATGVLTTGITLAKPQPVQQTEFTLLELMNIEGCKIYVERIGRSTSQSTVMLIVFTKEKNKPTVKSIVGLPEVINDHWGTPHIWFNTREELHTGMLNVINAKSSIDVDRYKMVMLCRLVQNQMGKDYLNNVIALKYVEEDNHCNTYVITEKDTKYRIIHSVRMKPEVAVRIFPTNNQSTKFI